MKSDYKQSENGNFKVIDTIGTPHPYCITPRHVACAADHYGGSLGEAAIKDAESKGARCGVRGCNLSFEEHEQALLVECHEGIVDNKELHTYLLDIKEQCEADGYAGFAFVDKR